MTSASVENHSRYVKASLLQSSSQLWCAQSSSTQVPNADSENILDKTITRTDVDNLFEEATVQAKEIGSKNVINDALSILFALNLIEKYSSPHS